MWRNVKCLTERKQDIAHIIIKTDDDTIVPVESTPEILATHFVTISATKSYSPEFKTIKAIIESIQLDFNSRLNIHYNKSFSIAELSWVLAECKGNSAGPDDIGYPLLKNFLFGD